MEAYRTIAAPASNAFVERKSRFIGAIAPVDTEAAALRFLADVRASHREAGHNVYAYILREPGITRYSDDGEPQGTGGLPALGVLQREGLTDVVVVITRYFGGILLGAGGLTRAYAHGASLAVSAAEAVWMQPAVRAALAVPYPLYDRLLRLLPAHRAVVEQSDFAEAVALQILLPEAALPGLTQALSEMSAGAVRPADIRRLWSAFPEA